MRDLLPVVLSSKSGGCPNRHLFRHGFVARILTSFVIMTDTATDCLQSLFHSDTFSCPVTAAVSYALLARRLAHKQNLPISKSCRPGLPRRRGRCRRCHAHATPFQRPGCTSIGHSFGSRRATKCRRPIRQRRKDFALAFAKSTGHHAPPFLISGPLSKKGFSPSDPYYQHVCRGYDAMQTLVNQTHYLTCSGVGLPCSEEGDEK
jgi:hypothetical protein